VLASLATELAGKILISSNNAWIPEDYEAAGLSPSLTEGTWMAALVPGMTIVRAFSHIDWQYLAPKATTEPGIYAADKMVEELIADMGYVPYRIGTLAESAVLDFDGTLSHFLHAGPRANRPGRRTDPLQMKAHRSSRFKRLDRRATKTGSSRLQPAPAEGFLLSSG